MTLNEVQQGTIALLDSAANHTKLTRWIMGYIPEHYKRLSIGMEEACELARMGAEEAYSQFGTRLYFTQALLMGAVISGRYDSFVVVTPSQYGKSWLCGQIAIYLANQDRQVYVTGGDTNTTEIILGKVMGHIQKVDAEIKQKLLEPADKIERLQTSVSKRKIAFRGGGLIESLSLGETFNDPRKGNAAIGRGGDYLIDEASLVSEDAYAELGRREFANVNGEKYISFEISNPHNPGRFFDKLTATEVPAGTLIVWMDARTALEEGRFKSKEQVTSSEFFKNKSTCKRYLLCELEDYTEESLFTEPVIDDREPEGLTYYLGIDSAYKGKDKIEVVLGGLGPDGIIRLLDYMTIHKANWVDGETSRRIIHDLTRIINAYGVQMACVDVGYGVYIVEGLAQRAECAVKGINFGAGTTKARKESRHFSAVYGDNMRAELHLDLQDLMEHNRITMTSEVAKALKLQMNAVKATRKPNGKTAIIAKEQIKQIIGKSPDELDAALLCVHAALLHSMYDGVEIYGGG